MIWDRESVWKMEKWNACHEWGFCKTNTQWLQTITWAMIVNLSQQGQLSEYMQVTVNIWILETESASRLYLYMVNSKYK